MALLLSELASFVWALGRIRRWQRGRAPRRLRPSAIALGAPLALDLLILGLFFIVAPAALGASIDLFSPFTPDLPLVMWLALWLAGVWGPIRTLWFLYLIWLRPAAAPNTRPQEVVT